MVEGEVATGTGEVVRVIVLDVEVSEQEARTMLKSSASIAIHPKDRCLLGESSIDTS
jgi:hypothetical protein